MEKAKFKRISNEDYKTLSNLAAKPVAPNKRSPESPEVDIKIIRDNANKPSLILTLETYDLYRKSPYKSRRIGRVSKKKPKTFKKIDQGDRSPRSVSRPTARSPQLEEDRKSLSDQSSSNFDESSLSNLSINEPVEEENPVYFIKFHSYKDFQMMSKIRDVLEQRRKLMEDPELLKELQSQESSSKCGSGFETVDQIVKKIKSSKTEEAPTSSQTTSQVSCQDLPSSPEAMEINYCSMKMKMDL